MAILHGSWLPLQQTTLNVAENAEAEKRQGNHPSDALSRLHPAGADPSTRFPAGCLFIWGEVWRRISVDALKPGTENGNTEGLAVLQYRSIPLQ